MNIGDMLEKAFVTLTNDGTFHIDRIDYDEENFGNICVVLSSNNQVDIRFINDRGVYWCEVGQAGEWYFIDDVFALTGITFVNESDDMFNFMTRMAILIRRNIPEISRAFNPKNSEDTKTKIKTLAKKRAMGMLKQ